LITSATLSFMRIAPIGMPCERDDDVSERQLQLETDDEERQRERGRTLASGLAMVTTSGWQSTGIEPCAQNEPVRPRPHCERASEGGRERVSSS